jgi:glucan phosphoethanolaminetransferase (alkaline phosphatase superfamily)
MPYDDDSNGGWSSSPYTAHVIVTAIIVGLLIFLFIWLLPIIGWIFVALLVILLVILIIWGAIWLVRQAATAGRKQAWKEKRRAAKQSEE